MGGFHVVGVWKGEMLEKAGVFVFFPIEMVFFVEQNHCTQVTNVLKRYFFLQKRCIISIIRLVSYLCIQKCHLTRHLRLPELGGMQGPEFLFFRGGKWGGNVFRFKIKNT